MGRLRTLINSVNPGNYTNTLNDDYQKIMKESKEYGAIQAYNELAVYDPDRGGGFDFYKDTQDNMGYIGGTTRPGNPLPYLSTDTGAKYPLFPIPLVRLFEMANNIPDVKTVLNVIQREMFKNDFSIQPKFNFKCKNCGKEFDKKPLEKLNLVENQKKKPELQCDICEKKGEDNFRKPDPYQRQLIEDLFTGTVNANKQNIEDLARQFEFDLDVADNAYCLVLKDYYLKKLKTPNADGAELEIDEKLTRFSEFLRIHPAQVAFIADADGRMGYDDNKNKVYVCPDFRHRNKKLIKPVCPECKAQAIPALMEANTIFSTGIIQPKKVIYAEGECIWAAGKYTPDMLYGYPSLISIWKKAMGLFHMDEYILKYYDKQRPPRSLLFINSRNAASVKQFWEKQRQGAREDPTMPRIVTVENEKGGAKNAAQLIDVMGKLTDLQFTEVRDELRQALFASYGFPPFLFGKVDKGGFGGANMQMTEVNRTIKASQIYLKKKFLDPVTMMIGAYDWEVVINKSEETDDLRDQQLLGQKIDNAVKLYVDLGFDVWLDGNNDPQSSQVPNQETLKARMGGNDSGNKAKSTKPKEEEDTKFQGEIHNKRPSDVGGSAQGDPNSGSSLQNKGLDDKALDDNVRYTFAHGIENGWTQTHMANEINKLLPQMTHNEAYTFVKESLRAGMFK